MSKLFIIGNGFDLAHGLKTRYGDFRDYLEAYHEDFLSSFDKMYDVPQIDYCHSHRIDIEFLENKRKKIIEKEWKNFEIYLGKANEEAMIELSSNVVSNLKLDSGLVGIEDTMNYYWENEYGFINNFQEHITCWIKELLIDDILRMKNEFIKNDNDYFLTFNYTNVLECVYNIDNNRVLHIHGGIEPYCNTPPILGHGNIDILNKYNMIAMKADNDFDEAKKSISNAIVNFFGSLYKDTEKYLTSNEVFFQKLSDIKFIEIIGHSLGDVDLIYFKKIASIVKEDVNWTIYYYNEDEKLIFRSQLMSIGISINNISLEPFNKFF